MATDAELNEYVGLKKLAPYRKGKNRDGWDPKRVERLKELKSKVGSRIGGLHASSTPTWGRAAGTEEDRDVKKKRKGKKERERAKLGGAAEVDVKSESPAVHDINRSQDAGMVEVQENGEPPRKKHKRKRPSVNGGHI